MRTRSRMLLAAFAVPFVSVAMAQPGPEPLAFVCTLSETVVAEYLDQWQFLTPGDTMSITVAAIDPIARTAQLVVNAGAAPMMEIEPKLIFVRGASVWNFVEITPVGNVNLLTVYEANAAGLHPAVYSRHPAILGDPLPSQFHGFCDGRS